jgi:hypothetical protein
MNYLNDFRSAGVPATRISSTILSFCEELFEAQRRDIGRSRLGDTLIVSPLRLPRPLYVPFFLWLSYLSCRRFNEGGHSQAH